MNFRINHNFSPNDWIEFKSVRINQLRVHVYLKENRNILHMRQAEVRESVEELQSTFDLAFC